MNAAGKFLLEVKTQTPLRSHLGVLNLLNDGILKEKGLFNHDRLSTPPSFKLTKEPYVRCLIRLSPPRPESSSPVFSPFGRVFAINTCFFFLFSFSSLRGTGRSFPPQFFPVFVFSDVFSFVSFFFSCPPRKGTLQEAVYNR